LEILVACYVLKKQGTAFVLNDYKTILYHAPQWRKRLVHKKIKSLPAHGAKRPFMVPVGPPSAKASARQATHGEKRSVFALASFAGTRPSSLLRASPDWQFMEKHADQLSAAIYPLCTL